MLQTLTIFGEAEQSGIGALGFDAKAFVIQLLTFLLVFLVLRRFAFKPILKALNDRREVIEKGVQLGEKMQKDQAELEQKVAETMREARKSADKMIADAQQVGRQTVQEAEDAARQKAEGLITQASERIKQDTVLARRRLQKDVASLVAEATEAIIHEKVDATKDAVLIERALQESRSS